VVAHLGSRCEALGWIPSIAKKKKKFKLKKFGGHWLLTPVILATQEAELKRIIVQSQPGQIVLDTVSQKYPTGLMK
jgi:hypothetical protein